MDFLDIVMEARRKRTVNIKQPATKSTDYTEEVEDTEDEDQEEQDDNQEENTDDSTTTDDVPEDNEPNDYTEETPDDDDTVESDEAEPVDNVDDTSTDGDVPEDNEPNDYTEDNPDDTPEEGSGDGTDDTGDSDGVSDDSPTDGGDVPSDEDVDSAEDSTEQSEDDVRNKRLLQEDYVDLYFKTKDFITKLNSLDKTNTILNQITVQIDKNLNRLKKALWDYVVYEYDKATYITSLYKYNQFIEAFKVNLELLSLAREHILKDSEIDSKKPKTSKRK